MGRLVAGRVAAMIPTLLLVSVLVFVLAQVLPGDVGRTILGPYASPDQVAALDRRLGADRPLSIRYVDWLARFVTGDWGDSLLLQTPVRSLVAGRFANSVQLAVVALVITVPVSIGLGVLAGLRQNRWADRVISIVGLSLVAVPEFVSGVVLIVVLAVMLHWFPISALAPAGASLPDRYYHLILPALPLGLVLFGYLARMARAGTVAVKDSDYIRTATLAGVARHRVLIRHLLRNALAPTIAVLGAQVGWMVGGLVIIETLFDYPGIGKLIYDSAVGHDTPVLQAATLLVAAVYLLSNLAADLITAGLDPRLRGGRS